MEHWITSIAAIAKHAWTGQTGMWAIPALLPHAPKAREKALFRNEIAHAKLKLQRREQAIARQTIEAKSAKIDTKAARLDRMRASLERTREQDARRDAERVARETQAHEKEIRLRAEILLRNGSASGRATVIGRYLGAIKR